MKKIIRLIAFLCVLCASAVSLFAAGGVQQPDLGIRTVMFAGADPTGASNSQPAFQSAGTSYGVVYVGSGTYMLNSNVTSGTVWLIGPGVTWTGTGSITGGTVLILAQLGSTSSVTIADGVPVCTNGTTGVPQACTAAQLIALFSGCSGGGQYLGSDGACHSASVVPVVNQYDETASRVLGQIYQNTGSGSISINVQTASSGGSFDLELLTGSTSPPTSIVWHQGVVAATGGPSLLDVPLTATAVVPSGYYYEATNILYSAGVLEHWTEWGPTSGTPEAILVADSFNRGNGDLGSNWTTITGYDAPAIVSAAAQGGTALAHNGAYYSAVSFPADQYAQGIIVGTTGGADWGLTVRTSPSAATYYTCEASVQNDDLRIHKVVGGVDTSEIDSSCAGTPVTNGATVYCSVTGTTTPVIIATCNGCVSTWQDSSSPITSGSPGINFYGVPEYSMTNFQAGSLP